MTDYIERELVKAKFSGYYTADWAHHTDYDVEVIQAKLDAIPAADVRPVVWGEWIGYESDKPQWQRDDGSPVYLECDQCGEIVLNNGSPFWNFCPCCGAFMRGVDD